MIHNLKIKECFADAIVAGDKAFEIRRNDDRGFQKGDIVKFSVLDRLGVHRMHDIDRNEYEITYVMSGYGLEKDWVVFGFRKWRSDDEG